MAASDRDKLKDTPEHMSDSPLAKASLLPNSPNGASKAPSGKFKMILARLTEEFDDVSAMLEKEINHRVHLEAKIASLSAQMEKQAEMAALGDTKLQAIKNEAYHDLEFTTATSAEALVKKEDITLKVCDAKDDAPEGNHLLMQKSATRLSGGSVQSDAKSLKSRKEEQLQELELIRGWREVDVSETNESRRTIVEKVGMVRANARRMVESQAFDAICSIAIIYNAALLGAAADYAAVNNTDPQKPPVFYKVSDRICTGWFCFELIIRLSSEGFYDFFMGPLWTWNLFDFIVVASDMLMTILDAIAAQTQVDFSFLRMLRVLRVTRAIRVVRLVRFFKELRMMVFSVLRSGTSLLWSLILFGIIHYIFGIFLLQQVNDYLWDQYEGDFESAAEEHKDKIHRFQNYWGSLVSALYTMYACMSGGVSWADVADDVIEISWLNGVILGFFIFFCTVVVMNIITGIFVDTAIQSAQSDRDEIIQEQIHSQESELANLRQAFLEADNDGSATITLPEFQSHLQDKRVRAHLASIGLEVNEAMGLFKLLDIDGSGHVGIEEFVVGCMRLKGGAKSIDLATLMYENKRMVEQHSHFHEFCEKKFSEILVATEGLKKDITQPLFAPQGEKHYLV